MFSIVNGRCCLLNYSKSVGVDMFLDEYKDSTEKVYYLNPTLKDWLNENCENHWFWEVKRNKDVDEENVVVFYDVYLYFNSMNDRLMFRLKGMQDWFT